MIFSHNTFFLIGRSWVSPVEIAVENTHGGVKSASFRYHTQVHMVFNIVYVYMHIESLLM